ncbi:MAG: hypothetical protein ABI699_14660 [Caldimonas sp.]
MHGLSLSLRTALAVASLGLIALSHSAQAQAQDRPGRQGSLVSAAAQACERETRQALRGRGLAGVEVSFDAAPALQPGLSSDSQVVLRGTARWRRAGDALSIIYSCNVDLRSFEVGLVLRDTTPAAGPAAPTRAPAEPDLSALSPAACESSAAEALKRRWPRVSEISFDSATRTFRQPSATRGELHGSGRATPAPGATPSVFAFDCELDPRDGRVLRTILSS